MPLRASIAYRGRGSAEEQRPSAALDRKAGRERQRFRGRAGGRDGEQVLDAGNAGIGRVDGAHHPGHVAGRGVPRFRAAAAAAS